MQSELSKELKKIRINEGENLQKMAQRINKSASFISAIETGKKPPPQGFEDLIINTYKLAAGAAEVLRRATNISRKVFTIAPQSELGKDTAGLLARQIDSLSFDDLESIREILLKGAKINEE